jgi:hypothetical protein
MLGGISSGTRLCITQLQASLRRGFFCTEIESAADPNVDSEIANTDATMSRILLNCYISGTFIALQYLVCLTYIFLKL